MAVPPAQRRHPCVVHWLCRLIALLATALPASAQAPDLGLRGHGGPIRSIAVLDEKTVVTGGFDSAIIVWDLPSGTARDIHRLHMGSVNALIGRSPNCFASGGDDGLAYSTCFEPKKSARKLHFTYPIGAIAAVADSSDGTWMASASWDRRVRAWPRSAPPAILSGPSPIVAEHKGPVTAVLFAADSRRIVSASYDGEVRVTVLDHDDLAKSRILRQTQIPAALNGLAMLPDDRIVLTAADGHVRVLNPDLTPSFEIELPDGPLTAVAVSPDGKTIAVAGMRTPVALIDVEKRTVARRILGPGLPVWALAFSLESRELFTGGADRALRRWTVATGEPVGNPLSPAVDLIGKPDPDPGARVFRACAVCHTVKPEDTQRAGPSLHGIMGRRIASAPGYDYSDALKKMDIVWTPETIAKLFEIGPTLYTPGTKMPEQRLTDPADRQALVEWLAKVTKPQAAP